MGADSIDTKSAVSLDTKALAQDFFNLHYDELMVIARRKRRRGSFSDSLQSSDILHESFLKLTGKTFWESKGHFFATMTLAIRHVIVDHARRKQAAKRGAEAEHVSFEEERDCLNAYSETPEQILEISDLLEKLGAENPRWEKIVNARYFSGMTEEETALVMDISSRTVRRDWNAARDWLADAMG